MKKLSLLLLSLTTLMVGVGLISCDTKPNPGDKPEPTPEPQPEPNPTDPKVEIKDGFTSILAKSTDKDINKPLVEKNGKKYYQIAGLEIEVKDTLNLLYAADVHNDDKFNYLKAGHAESSEIYASMVDGLFDNTKTRRLVGMLAVAEKEDRTNAENPTFSYQLRKNVPWVVNETGQIYEVEGKKQYIKAEDFVEAAFYNLSTKETNTFLYNLFIKGAEEYNTWALADENIEKSEEEKRAKFAKLVGVKATEEDVISYTLTKDINYFKTVTTYSPYYPVNKNFLKEKGSNFGETENDILVSGAYRITEYTKESKYVYTANEHYWDKEHVYLKTINNIYFKSGLATDHTRQLFEKDQIDSFSVSSADIEGWNKYIGEGNTVLTPKSDLVTPIESKDSSTFFGLFNFNRKTFEYNELATKTQKQIKDTQSLFLNKEFRLGLLHGTEFVKTRLTSVKTPHEFLYRRYVSENLAFDADGKDYVDYFDAVYNEKNGTSFKLTGFDTGFDPVYNEGKAREEFKKAYEALKTVEGIQFPILVDVIGSNDIIGKQEQINRYRMVEELAKQEDGVYLVKFRLNYPQNDSQYSEWNRTHNYDMNSTGWGPDYADPNTFFDTLKINGDYAPAYGLKFNANKASANPESEDAKTKQLAEQLFGKFTKMVNEANKITDSKERFKKLAEAEYYIIYEEGLAQPYFRRSRVTPSVSKIIPFQSAKVGYGNNSSRMKNVVVATTVLPRSEKNKIIKHFNELNGKKSEQFTIQLLNSSSTLFESYIGIPDTLTVSSGQSVILPQGIDKNTKKVVRKWYTDPEFKNEVKNTEGALQVTSNLTLYGKEEDLNLLTSLELQSVASETNIAKAKDQVDSSYTFPILASDKYSYQFTVKPTFKAESSYLDDNLSVKVVAEDEKDPVAVEAAKAIKAIYTSTTKGLVVTYPAEFSNSKFNGKVVKVVISGDNSEASSSKEYKFVLKEVTTNLTDLFAGDKLELTKPEGLTVVFENKSPEVATQPKPVEEGKYTAAKSGTIEISAKFTLENENVKIDLTQSLTFKVLEVVLVGQKFDLNVEGKTLTFEVSDQEAATFENGVLTIKALGKTATVTVKENETVLRTFTIKTASAVQPRAIQIYEILLPYSENKAFTQASRDALKAKLDELFVKINNIASTDEELLTARKEAIAGYYALVEEK